MPTKNIIFSKITNLDGPLTKTIRPDGNGGIMKESSAHLTRGTSEVIDLPFGEFGPFLRTLKSNQAICHGVTTSIGQVNIITARKFSGQPGTVTRTLEHFHYSDGIGVGMFDHDPKPGQKALTPDMFLDIIYKVYPDFKKVPLWTTPSTSSCIYDLDGNELSVEGNGFHMYFPFEPANKLPAFAQWLYKKLWIAGYGYIFISKSGALLERSIFDTTVFSPERLDFVAGAQCIDCEQRLPDPVYTESQEVII